MKVEKSIHINCAPEKVFAFVTDFSNAPKWMVGYIESKVLTEGETRVGTQYMVVSKLLGQKMEMKSEITVWEPPRCYEYKTLDGPAMTGRITCTPADGSTLVTFLGDGEFSGLFKLAEGMLKGQMEKTMDEALQALKKTLEG
ncbi:MAG: SRPBCC family protein [Chloroflexota bacterium]